MFIKELQNEGFTPQQAESLCKLFKEVVNYVVNDIKNECVTRSVQVCRFEVNFIFCILFKIKKLIGISDTTSYDTYSVIKERHDNSRKK